MTNYQAYVAQEIRNAADLIGEIGTTKAGEFDGFFSTRHAVSREDVLVALERAIGAIKHHDFAKSESELQADRDALAEREVRDCVWRQA